MLKGRGFSLVLAGPAIVILPAAVELSLAAFLVLIIAHKHVLVLLGSTLIVYVLENL